MSLSGGIVALHVHACAVHVQCHINYTCISMCIKLVYMYMYINFIIAIFCTRCDSLVMKWRFTDRVRKQMDAFLKVHVHTR